MTDERKDSAAAAALSVDVSAAGAPDDGGREGAASASAAGGRPANRRARLVAAAVAAVSVVLIGVSAFALFTSMGGAFDPIDALKTTADAPESTVVAASGGADAGDVAPADADDGVAADEDAAAEEPQLHDVGQDGASASDSAAVGSGATASGYGGAADSTASVGGGGDASADSSPGASSGAADTSQQPDSITVSVSIDSSVVGSPVSLSAQVTLASGATVFDALMATGVAYSASSTLYGTYMAAIGGLAEKQHGGKSGWTYYVNGQFINTACSNYTLSPGDAVSWVYVV